MPRGKKAITTEEFIARAKDAHGDKYDYSKTIYVLSTIKVLIACSVHNGFIFEQTPTDHLKGNGGCPKCWGRIRTTEEWIEKAKTVHGNKYDYSSVNYVNSTKTKITIICTEHGKFEQMPRNHLNGNGCSECAKIFVSNKFAFTTEKFIEKARAFHGNKYDYSLVEYVHSHEKVKIGCDIHGFFLQTASTHMNGQGCYSCGRKTLAKNLHKNLDWFLDKARLVHGDKYDYSKVIYVKSRSHVIIVCKTHGDFSQAPMKHFFGQGCPKCTGRNLTTNDWVKHAKSIHGNRYEYDFVEYNGNKTKVKIMCKIHGIFEQMPYNHINGNGCSTCSFSKLEIKVQTYLDTNNIKFEAEKKFEDCKNKTYLPYDFFISNFESKQIRIELQGEQHFNSSIYFNRKKNFQSILQTDNKKSLASIKNNNSFLSVSYLCKTGMNIIFDSFLERLKTVSLLARYYITPYLFFEYIKTNSGEIQYTKPELSIQDWSSDSKLLIYSVYWYNLKSLISPKPIVLKNCKLCNKSMPEKYMNLHYLTTSHKNLLSEKKADFKETFPNLLYVNNDGIPVVLEE